MQRPSLTPRPLTWREIVIREHRLAQLKRRIELARDNGKAATFCANALWYGHNGRDPGLRDEIARLVGPEARPDDPILGTSAALETVSTTLRALLSPCRGCDCARLIGLD